MNTVRYRIIITVKSDGTIEITIEPHNSKVILTLNGDCIHYERRIRPNPRAEMRMDEGNIFVKVDYEHSIWLEHEGRRLDYDGASELLMKDLFSSLLNKP